MRRRVPSQQLRGSDPITLEVQIRDLVAKPASQVAPANIADLFALDEVEELPGILRGILKGYRKRVGVEVADLPNGPSFAAFVDELREIDATRLPDSFRDMFGGEGDNPKRSSAEKGLVAELVASWAEVEPEPFSLGAAKAVFRAPAKPPREEPRARVRGGRGERPPRATTSERRTPTRTPAAPVDPARTSWVRQMCLERLAFGSGDGLAQTVLIAGVRHRAREKYPDLKPHEITAALKSLEQEGRIKRQAARWISREINRY